MANRGGEGRKSHRHQSFRGKTANTLLKKHQYRGRNSAQQEKGNQIPVQQIHLANPSRVR